MRTRRLMLGYGLAALLTALVGAARVYLDPVMGPQSPLLLFALAVLGAAYVGGLGPGMLATSLSAILGNYLVLSHRTSVLPVTADDQLQVALFLVIGSFISIVCEGLHRARQRSDADADAMRRSERNFRRFFEHAGVGMIQLDAHHRIRQVNPSFAAMLGYEPGELIGKDVIDDLTHPDDRAFSHALGPRVASGELDNCTFEKRYLRRDGAAIWVSQSLSIIRDVEGRELSALEVIQNIHDRRQAEQGLRHSELRYRTLTQATTAIVWSTMADGVVATEQPGWAAFTGQTFDEYKGWNWLDAVHPDDRAHTAEVWSRAVATRTMYEVTHRLRRRDGVYRDMSVRGVPILDDRGDVAEWIGVHTDVTEKAQTEAELHRRNQSLTLLADTATRLLLHERPSEILRALFDELADHVGAELYFSYLASDDGERLTLNAHRGVDDTTAAAVRELAFGQAVCGLVADTGSRIAYERVDALHDDEARLSIVKDIGMTAYCCHPLLARGRVVGTLSLGSRSRPRFAPHEMEVIQAFCDQVAMALERQRLSEELRTRADELTAASQAKDQFLATLSHELRTPLNPVLMAVSAMQRDGQVTAENRHDLEMIQRNVELEARLIDDLLDLTRIARNKLELRREPTDLDTILDHAIEACCRSDINIKRLDLRFERQARQRMVHADPARLQQVVWNLVKNAVKFTPAGGSITLRTSNVRDGFVTLEVIDTGIGIEPQKLANIFEAFQQGGRDVTKRFGGLGLGLAIAKAIIDAHGGSISAHSDGPNRGATFRIDVPLHIVPEIDGGSQSDDNGQTRRGASAANRKLSILLVEDHESTAKVMRRLLNGLHYDVAVAYDVATATQLAAQRAFDLVISDLGLPDGNGLDLMRHLRQQYGLQGIALSGYGMEDDVRLSREAGFLHHLVKPVSLHQLELTLALMKPQDNRTSVTRRN